MAASTLSVFRRARNRKKLSPTERAERREHRGNTLRSMGIAGLLWSVVLFLFYAAGQVSHTGLSVGQRARNTIVATTGFASIDMARTELIRQQSADDILPVFAIDYVDFNTASRSLTKLFDRLEALRSPTEPPPTLESIHASVADALDLLGFPITAEDALDLAPPGSEKEVLALLRDQLRSAWDRGIVAEHEQLSRFDGFATSGNISILTEDASMRSPVAIESLLLPTQAVDEVVSGVLTAVASEDISETALRTLVGQWLEPNLRYDAARTGTLRSDATKRVPTATRQVAADTTLVEAGERITPQIMEDILAHEQRRSQVESPRDRIMDRIGHAALLLMGLIIVGGMLRVNQPEILMNPRMVGMLALLSLLTIVPAKLLLLTSTTTKLLPHALIEPLAPLALAPLVGAILAGGGAAIAIGVWTSFVVSLLFAHSYTMFVLGLVVTMVAAGSARETRKRSHLFRIGATIGLAAVATVLCLGVLNQQSFDALLPQMLAALVGGLICALLAALLIPLFEWLFKITTDITLLELSDMGHPLLRRLAMDAPGTYHHSLMVANLAQAAATEVGANALLVRVCAYFHDIGKMAKPEFFVENSQFTQNPHDDLSPNMSALVIIAHVKEGIALANRHKLPTPILDGITQHHGTSLIFYFYHRACKQQELEGDSGRRISEADFRYPGPKPQNREMGILHLADSLEAASRSIEKPTVSRIENLVNEIVDSRLQDGQLDECDLTFSQLTAIKRSFIFTLTNMLHGRVKYPKNENRDQQPAKPQPDKPREASTLQPVAHEAG